MVVSTDLQRADEPWPLWTRRRALMSLREYSMNHNETGIIRNLLHVETRILHRPGSQRTSYWNLRDTLIIRTTMRWLSCLKLGCRIKVLTEVYPDIYRYILRIFKVFLKWWHKRIILCVCRNKSEKKRDSFSLF